MDGKPHARVRIRCILRSPQGELPIFGAFDRLILLGRILAVRDVEVPMRYLAAWLLGVPLGLIVLWFVVGHAACSR